MGTAGFRALHSVAVVVPEFAPARRLFALMVLANALAGCGDLETPVAGQAPVGAVSLALQLPGGVRIDAVDYELTGPAYHATGRFNVAGSSTVGGVLGGLPLGNGYLVTLRATDIDHHLTSCEGAAGFDVATPGTVPVTVQIRCREVRAPVVAAQAVPLSRGYLLVFGGLLAALGTAVLRRPTAGSPHRSR
jgi:hypothetical protein